jgi:hypothetical protein
MGLRYIKATQKYYSATSKYPNPAINKMTGKQISFYAIPAEEYLKL